MGHSNDSIFQSYISSLVGIDTQSLVHGRAQRMDLINSNSSMMFKRNLLAPMPPAPLLTDMSPRQANKHPAQGSTNDIDLYHFDRVFNIILQSADSSPKGANSSLAQQYFEERRQLSKKNFQEERKQFFNGPEDSTIIRLIPASTSRPPSW